MTGKCGVRGTSRRNTYSRYCWSGGSYVLCHLGSILVKHETSCFLIKRDWEVRNLRPGGSAIATGRFAKLDPEVRCI